MCTHIWVKYTFVLILFLFLYIWNSFCIKCILLKQILQTTVVHNSHKIFMILFKCHSFISNFSSNVYHMSTDLSILKAMWNPIGIEVIMKTGNVEMKIIISMGQCKKDVTPLLMHWSYIFLALTHQYESEIWSPIWVLYWYFLWNLGRRQMSVLLLISFHPFSRLAMRLTSEL